MPTSGRPDRLDYKQQAQTGRLFEPEIELVESLPRSAIGKVLNRELRDAGRKKTLALS